MKVLFNENKLLHSKNSTIFQSKYVSTVYLRKN